MGDAIQTLLRVSPFRSHSSAIVTGKKQQELGTKVVGSKREGYRFQKSEGHLVVPSARTCLQTLVSPDINKGLCPQKRKTHKAASSLCSKVLRTESAMIIANSSTTSTSKTTDSGHWVLT